MKVFLNFLRSIALRAINIRNIQDCLRGLNGSKLFNFIVLTPHTVHMAPLAVRNQAAGIQPVLIANGLNADDLNWVKRVIPNASILPLKTSFKDSTRSLLSHGTIIDCLSQVFGSTFCIQDADCFVTDMKFWDSFLLDPKKEYAAGPFIRRGEKGQVDFPETFLTILNGNLMESFRRKYKITAETTARPKQKAKRMLERAGYPDGIFLDIEKKYFDTLQLFWILARAQGLWFRLVPGAQESVFHIGGVSYMYQKTIDIGRYGYWVLHGHYFNLALLEYQACEQFRPRFDRLFKLHGSAQNLLTTYPEYKKSRSFEEVQHILRTLQADKIYTSAVSRCLAGKESDEFSESLS